jgi:hypothetical protein
MDESMELTSPVTQSSQQGYDSICDECGAICDTRFDVAQDRSGICHECLVGVMGAPYEEWYQPRPWSASLP